MSFVMNVADIYYRYVMVLALRGLDHLLLSYLVKLIYVQSLHALIINLNLLWYVCFLLLLMGDLLLSP
jgi:hypothetical protein